MESSKDFYKKHASKVRITPRAITIVSLILPYLKEAKTVLDVGCGNGYITYHMSAFCATMGIDMQVDITESPDLGKFDIVTCFDVLEHIKDKEKAIDNLKSNCKDSGIIILNIPKFSDKTQPFDEPVVLSALINRLQPYELVHFERYGFNDLEIYGFAVFQCLS